MISNLKRNLTVLFLIVVTLIDFMGLGIVVTIFPKLLLDPSSYLLPASWKYASKLTALGLFLAIYPLGQFFGAAILGKLSDHAGRKKLLIVTLIGTMIGFLVSGLAIAIQSALILFISRLFSGLFAGNIAIVQAGLADISPDEKTKNRNFSLFQVALGVSWVFGPPMGGWLSSSSLCSWFNYTTPFWAISILLSIILLITIFYFRESLQNPSRDKIEVLGGIKQIYRAFFMPKLKIVFIIWFILVSGWWLFEAFLPTYLLQNFHFKPSQIGNFLAFMGATYALFQVLVVQRFSSLKPTAMVKGSLLIAGASVIGIAFVHSTLALHIVVVLFVTSMGFALPGVIISISNLANAAEQGQVMGMISSIQAIATVIMMMLGGWLESFGLGVTVIGGGTLLITAWVMFMLCFHKKNKITTSAQLES